jgi:branched-chain amino acid transport system substrate-binding protein
LTNGQRRVTAAGSTVGKLIDSLDAEFPGVKERLVDGTRLRRGIAVSVDGTVATRGLLEPVGETSEVQFFPAIAGGDVQQGVLAVHWKAGNVLGILLLLAVLSACAAPVHFARPTLKLGAIYPLSGPQGVGGREELAGVKTAVAIINADGGVGGRQVVLDVRDATTPEDGIAAVDSLVEKAHVPVILGSYSSVVAVAASAEANRLRTVWWETGAVADAVTLPRGAMSVPYVFRTVATGSNLGRMSARFTSDVLLPTWGMDKAAARVVILYEDDVYGQSVASGATAEARDRGLAIADTIAYSASDVRPEALVQKVAAAHPDFLWDASYLNDGIAIWRAAVAANLRLKGAIGTSSAFCMPEFGAALGTKAAGLYASDKPDAAVSADALDPSAQALLARARAEFIKTEHHNMGISGLTGFVGAWALLHDVAPHSTSLTPDGFRAAALLVDLPYGSEINGEGLRFGPEGGANAGQNQRAASVVWQWQQGGQVVVFPDVYRTAFPRVTMIP